MNTSKTCSRLGLPATILMKSTRLTGGHRSWRTEMGVRVSRLFAILAWLTSCSGSVDPATCPADRTPQCEISYNYAISSYFSLAQQDLIAQGANNWNFNSKGRICLILSPVSQASIYIGPTLRSHLSPQVRATTNYPEIRIATDNEPDLLPTIAAHEFGHAMGAKHTATGLMALTPTSSTVSMTDVEAVCLERGCQCL